MNCDGSLHLSETLQNEQTNFNENSGSEYRTMQMWAFVCLYEMSRYTSVVCDPSVIRKQKTPGSLQPSVSYASLSDHLPYTFVALSSHYIYAGFHS